MQDRYREASPGESRQLLIPTVEMQLQVAKGNGMNVR